MVLVEALVKGENCCDRSGILVGLLLPRFPSNGQINHFVGAKFDPAAVLQ